MQVWSAGLRQLSISCCMEERKILTARAAWKFSRPRDELNRSTSLIFTYVKSPLVAEGLALRSAMEQAILLDYKQIFFESDLKLLVTAIVEGSDICVESFRILGLWREPLPRSLFVGFLGTLFLLLIF